MAPPTRFPRFEQYVSRLPKGLDSYPEYRCRASVYRIFTDKMDLASFPFEDVPVQIRTLLKSPFLHDSWLAEPPAVATILAAADFLGLDDAAARRWVDETNARLVGGRMYRTMMSLATPSILVALASRQWGVFHRGTKINVQRGKPTMIRIDFPPFLYDELLAEATAAGIRHALTLSRAKDPTVEIEEHAPTHTIYRVAWT